MPQPSSIALAVFGILTGAAVLLIFKFTSKPDRVLLARNRALSRVLELWLCRQDPLLSLRSIGSMMLDSVRYLGTLLIPMLCSLLPMLALLYVAHSHFAFRPLRPGETVLLVARLRPEAPLAALENAALTLPPGLEAAMPPVRTPAWREVAWALTMKTESGRATPPRALLRHIRDQRLPAFKALDLRLPPAEYNLLGWHTDWFWGILAISLAAGLVLKRPFGVEF